MEEKQIETEKFGIEISRAARKRMKAMAVEKEITLGAAYEAACSLWLRAAAVSDEHQMLDAILGDPKLAKDMRQYLKDHSGVAIERRKRAVAKPDQVEPGRKVS